MDKSNWLMALRFKCKKNARDKEGLPGQAMVEFALIFLLLMVIVLGLIESGRLLFIYGSVTTASRQAARYGSATGDNGTGTPQHLDCPGIENAAKEIGFLLPIADIDIQYTRDGITIADCDTTDGTYPLPSVVILENGDRIEITTTSHYAPMIAMGNFATFDITTESKRTIYIGITILVDTGASGSSAEITLQKIASPSTYSWHGQDITYSFILTNSGEVDLTSYAVSDLIFTGLNCSGNSLQTGASVTCYESYTTTTADVIAKSMVNVATATASDGTFSGSAHDTVTITFVEIPAITLTKEANPILTTTLNDTITYTYTVTNIGNIDLTTLNITDITDSGTYLSVSCPSGILSPAPEGPGYPGDSVVCTATYNITQDDLDAGEVSNTATATLTDGGSNSVSATTSAIVATKPLNLKIISNPTVYSQLGEEIVYTYRLQNYGPTLFALGDFSIVDDKFSGITCPNVTLNYMETAECTYAHIITQDDLDLGYIINTATAHAIHEGNNIVSGIRENTITALQEPALTLEKTGPAKALVTGDITYTFTLINTGNLTLELPYTIIDDLITDDHLDCTGATTPLLPNVSTTCTGLYTITSADIARGSLTNTATATAKIKVETLDGRSTVSSSSDSFTVITYDSPRLGLDITATVLGVPVSNGDTLMVDDVILFTYNLTNTGNTPLSYPFAVNGAGMLGSGDCSGITSNLELGETDTCTSIYSVAVGDKDKVLVNEASASAFASSVQVISNSDNISFPIILTCRLSAFWQDTSSNQYTHKWVIHNTSSVTATLSSLTIGWGNQDLDNVLINGTSVLASPTSTNPNSISLSNNIPTGNSNIVMTFSNKNSTPNISASFSDIACSSTILN